MIAAACAIDNNAGGLVRAGECDTIIARMVVGSGYLLDYGATDWDAQPIISSVIRPTENTILVTDES